MLFKMSPKMVSFKGSENLADFFLTARLADLSKEDHRIDLSGHLTNKNALFNLIKTFGGKSFLNIQSSDETHTFYYTFPDNAFCSLYLHSKRNSHITFSSYDKALTETFKTSCKKLFTKVQQNCVYIMTSGPGGIDLSVVGQLQVDLEPANYLSETIESYNHVTACLNSNDPCGRLILMEGPPGTGKSYLLRSLISSVSSTMFILVSPSLIGELSGPDIISTILTYKDATKKSMTLILEDADASLVARSQGNLGQLSEVLNMGDGILGDLVDLRIIATTNAKKLDIDEAVLRPGRLCQHIHVPCIDHKKAASIYERLVGKKYYEDKHKLTTLADAYRAARQDGWVPSKSDTVATGNYI